MANTAALGSVGILWRGDPRKSTPTRENNRLDKVFDALEACLITPVPIVYSDDVVDQVHAQIVALDGVLVWVDPIVRGQDRSKLDAILRDASSKGVWVSAHPDIIMKMGTKEVLFRTRNLGWGTDTYVYYTPDELLKGLSQRLQAGPRVVKQCRGSGGDGTWKVEMVRDALPAGKTVVRVLHALYGSRFEELLLDDFVVRCRSYFTSSGCMVDQPFISRLGDGMIRCYLVQNRVSGFGFQYVKALMPPPPVGASPEAAAVPPRLYYGPQKPEFQAIKRVLESEWVPQMQQLLDIQTESLPAIWDADFMLGSRTASGEDTYVLGEINVQGVFPFPDEALEPLALTVKERITANRANRR